MTKGVVSRVTSKGFAIDHFPSPSQLAIQIDAAINPGNSGGPALYSPKDYAKPVCLGVATQKDTGVATDNIGFLVPAGTVRRFLQDVGEHGDFRGVPSPGFLWTPLENVVLRKRHSLDPDTNEGVLVTGIQT
jgi:S1-C subfamily serine protease